MEAKDYLRAFYEEHCDEDARLRSRHGMVEFLTTMRYIERYLKPGGKILEIGAGTGRYSHALAQKGYAVDAVELLEHNINVFRQNTLPGEPVTFKLSSDPAEVFALHRREEIDALMEGLPVERLHFVGTDMATGYMRDTVDQMDGELYELYLNYHFAICERADLVGASNHYLDIFKKL